MKHGVRPAIVAPTPVRFEVLSVHCRDFRLVRVVAIAVSPAVLTWARAGLSARELSAEEGSGEAQGHIGDYPEEPEICTRDGDVLVHERESPVEPPSTRTVTARIPVSVAYLVGADGRPKVTMAPPMKKAAATTHPAMIHRCVGWSMLPVRRPSGERVVTSSAFGTNSREPLYFLRRRRGWAERNDI